MTRIFKFFFIATLAVATSNIWADAFDGNNDGDGGDGVAWHDPNNWLLDAVPPNNGGGNTFINDGFDVVYDSATWNYLNTNSLLQSATQHRVVRFILNENTAASSGPIGTNSLTFDFADPGGALREVLQTNGTSAIFAGRNGSDTTVEMISGRVNTGSRTTFGARTGALGTLNLSGGEFITGRSNLQLGIQNDLTTTSGTGVVNVTGGTLRTREGVGIGGTSTFHVAGSAITEIGVGSQGSVDGMWTQEAGGVLRTGIDAGGITAILIDDYQDDGGGTQGNATFASGSVLDPYDLGGAATNTWTTVMTWEGMVTDNGLGLSPAATAAGWTHRIDGNDLQVCLDCVPVPEPSSLALIAIAGLFGLSVRRRK